jgi:two-component system, NarL family, sensor histidine kinase DevS
MSTNARARQFEVEAAERRVIEQLKMTAPSPSTARRAAVVSAAVVLFAVTFAARLAVHDPNALLANFYVIPIALVAIEFGTRVGVLAAFAALGLVLAWTAIDTVHLSALGYSSRIAALLVTGVIVGRFSERLRADITERQHAQRRLTMYADELERANRHLGRSVEGLEAFAQIARAVGGETDLERVLSLILAHAREIVAARELIVYLSESDELAAVSRRAQHDATPVRLRVHGSLAGEVLLSGRPRRVSSDDHHRQLEQMMPGASAAILVPLVFRGEALGVLAGIDSVDGRPFADGDVQLLMSVAASAATAIATARSVAAARLRLSLEAAEQARARWARELHDETLQGLTGVRMVLSAGLARNDLGALHHAAETAYEHVGGEMRKLRDLIAELRPAALDDLGLGPAIESLANRQASIGEFAVEVKLELNPQRRLARDTETVTYRIVQEALSNVVKHAGARWVTLQVKQLPDRVELSVDDDGRGFEPDQLHEGFGLLGMRERALLVGGTLSVTSAHGAMTCVSAVLPVPA